MPFEFNSAFSHLKLGICVFDGIFIVDSSFKLFVFEHAHFIIYISQNRPNKKKYYRIQKLLTPFSELVCVENSLLSADANWDAFYDQQIVSRRKTR